MSLALAGILTAATVSGTPEAAAVPRECDPAASPDDPLRLVLVPPPIANAAATWSPDGTRIAWNGRTHENGRDLDYRGPFTDPSEVYVADPDGTNRIVIATVDAREPPPTENRNEAWSPDGARIAWIGTTTAGQRVFVANADGTDRVEVMSIFEGDEPIQALSWSPDGTRLAWQGHDDRTHIAELGASDRSMIDAADFAWSPDGARLAWSGQDGQIHVGAADGTDSVTISNTGVDPNPTDNADPQWSPDGTRLTWNGTDGSERHIYAADVDGSNRVAVSTVGSDPDPVANREARWSPDGAQIAWTGGEGLNRSLYVADSAGTNRIVASGPTTAYGRLTWSPDSGHIAWFGSDPDSTDAIYIAEPDGANRVLIGTFAHGLDWSPNGDRITYMATPTEFFWEVYVAAADGSGSERVSDVDMFVPEEPPRIGPHPFIDVAASSFADDDISCLFNLGITTGTSAATYSPTEPVTREQLAAFLARAWRALDNDCGSSHPFTDVPATSFANTDIGCIYQLGITTGNSDTTFAPEDLVTREQMASFLARTWRALDNDCGSSHPFTDVPATSFANTDVGCIYQRGITTGTTATSYSPTELVTREQMAAFLARLIRLDTKA